MKQLPTIAETPIGATRADWSKEVPAQVLASLSENEINRQTYGFCLEMIGQHA